MFNPGKMRNKIDFYDKDNWEENEIGEETQVPKKILSEFAEVRTFNGKEILEFGKKENITNYRIFMRFRKEIHEGMEVKWKNYNHLATGDITAIIPKGRYMEIQVKERVDLNG